MSLKKHENKVFQQKKSVAKKSQTNLNKFKNANKIKSQNASTQSMELPDE